MYTGRLNKKLKDNLKLEINILREMHHPHVVSLIDCDESTSAFHLIMEFCCVGDLSLFIRKRKNLIEHPVLGDIVRRYPNPAVGGLHEVLARHFLKQLASALHFLRANDLIHRDIKPQNLLLHAPPTFYSSGKLEMVSYQLRKDSYTPLVGIDSLPMLKIADFGFARSLPATSLAETLCGSPLYMAPEILRYERYDAKADLWSVGTVLYEMVVGKPPFKAGNHVDLLRKIEQGGDNIRFPPQMDVSPSVKHLIRALLKRNPVERLSFKEFFESSVVKGEIPDVLDRDLRAIRAVDPSAALRPASRESLPLRSLNSGKVESNLPSESPPSRPLAGALGRPATSPAVRRVGSRDKPDLQRVAVTGRKTSITSVTGSPGSPSREEFRRSQDKAPVAEPVQPSSLPTDRQSVRKGSSTRQKEEVDELEKERAAQDMSFERDYVVVEKRAVEVNAFADELAASPRFQQKNQQTGARQTGAIVRRATTTATSQPSSSPREVVSRAVTGVYGRPRTGSTHNRQNSYDRRYGPNAISATSAISKALNKASGRLFGVKFSPPLVEGSKSSESPPVGYNAFPVYPPSKNELAVVGDGVKIKPPLDEDTKILHLVEEIATRSDVVYGFAEVKYKQLAPLTPSMHADTAIKPVVNPGSADSCGMSDTGLTMDAIFTLSEEALVLYVKALSLLAKTMDVAGAWWAGKNRGETMSNPASVIIGQRVNNVVQWVRNRFNEVLQKAEYARLRLLDAQRQLPPDHAYHAAVGRMSVGYLAHSADQVVISSGITAEKLMFDRALEMSRTAAINELTGEDLPGCEIAYLTAIRMLEAVLESDEVPKLNRNRTSENNDEVQGLQGEDREVVFKCKSFSHLNLHRGLIC